MEATAETAGTVHTRWGVVEGLDVDELLVEHLDVGKLADEGLAVGKMVELRTSRSDPFTPFCLRARRSLFVRSLCFSAHSSHSTGGLPLERRCTLRMGRPHPVTHQTSCGVIELLLPHLAPHLCSALLAESRRSLAAVAMFHRADGAPAPCDAEARRHRVCLLLFRVRVALGGALLAERRRLAVVAAFAEGAPASSGAAACRGVLRLLPCDPSPVRCGAILTEPRGSRAFRRAHGVALFRALRAVPREHEERDALALVRLLPRRGGFSARSGTLLAERRRHAVVEVLHGADGAPASLPAAARSHLLLCTAFL